MREPELCVGCGQSLVGDGQLYISPRGGSLCPPCSDSVSLHRGSGPIARRSEIDKALVPRQVAVVRVRQSLP